MSDPRLSALLPPDRLLPGDLVPNFWGRGIGGTPFELEAIGGRYVVLAFFDGSRPDALLARRDLFDYETFCFVGVGDAGACPEAPPGFRLLREIDASARQRAGSEPCLLVLDPALRVIERFPVDAGAALLACLARLPPLAGPGSLAVAAPLLMLPGLLEPALCRGLVEAARPVLEAERPPPGYVVRDQAVRNQLYERIVRRLAPEIRKAFSFDVTRIEGYFIRCQEPGGTVYGAGRYGSGWRRRHVRFAVEVSLDSEACEGGGLYLPEFDRRPYQAPTGGALVHSGWVMHEAVPVRAGRRYFMQAFLFDEAAEQIRVANLERFGRGGAGQAPP